MESCYVLSIGLLLHRSRDYRLSVLINWSWNCLINSQMLAARKTLQKDYVFFLRNSALFFQTNVIAISLIYFLALPHHIFIHSVNWTVVVAIHSFVLVLLSYIHVFRNLTPVNTISGLINVSQFWLLLTTGSLILFVWTFGKRLLVIFHTQVNKWLTTCNTWAIENFFHWCLHSLI